MSGMGMLPPRVELACPCKALSFWHAMCVGIMILLRLYEFDAIW